MASDQATAKISDLRQSRRLEMINGSKPCGPAGGFRAPSPKRRRPRLQVSCSPSPQPSPRGEEETFARPLVKRPSSVVLCLRSERRRNGDRNRSVRIFQRCASALPHPQGEGESWPFLGKADAPLKRSPSEGDYKRDFGTFENCTNAVPSPGGDG